MTVAELREILEGQDDNDFIVIEVDETSLKDSQTGLSEDLYNFSVDFIDGIETNTGIQTEIRFTVLPHSMD